MVKYTVVQYLKQKKQHISGDENMLHFGLKLLCFAGLFRYEKICNTPKKLKLYRAYQITVHVLYCPIFVSQIVKFCLLSEDLNLAIETFTHILVSFGTCVITPLINWNDVYKLICKLDASMKNRISTNNDRKTTEILRETQRKCKFIILFMSILGIVALLSDLYDIFILHFVENIVGVEHKYKSDSNAANIYESLLLEKYPFSCWAPFGERSVTAHLAVYIYTTFPVLMAAFRGASLTSVLIGTLRYITLEFKFVCKSLEELSTMQDSDKLREQNTSSTPDEQHKCEEFNNTNIPVSATDGELLNTPSQAQITKCSNKHKNTDTSITKVHSVKDQEDKTDCDVLPSGNKSSPEESVVRIIKNHQEAIG
jgi:hypothetical protein